MYNGMFLLYSTLKFQRYSSLWCFGSFIILHGYIYIYIYHCMQNESLLHMTNKTSYPMTYNTRLMTLPDLWDIQYVIQTVQLPGG